MRRSTALCLLFASLTFLSSGAGAQEVRQVVAQESGIHASLTTVGTAVRLEWWYVAPSDARSATLKVDGVKVPPEGAKPYVDWLGANTADHPRGRTTILALVDLGGGPSRTLGITKLKSSALLLAEALRPIHDYVLATYADRASIVPNGGQGLAGLAAALMIAPVSPGRSAMSNAIAQAVTTLKETTSPYSRRAIYLFTDGHDDGAMGLAAAIGQARAANIPVFALIVGDARSADLPALARLVESTGGILVPQAAMIEFLRQPFASIDSGWVVDYDLGKVGSGALLATIGLAGGAPGVSLGMLYVAPGTPFPSGLAAAGIALVSFVAASFFFLGRTRRPASLDTPAPTPLANLSPSIPTPVPARHSPPKRVVLSEPRAYLVGADGKSHALTTACVRIGRAFTNDVVIQDETVSREHAILERGAQGAYEVVDRSNGNLLQVNGRSVTRTKLGSGDVLTLGAAKFTFREKADEYERAR